MVIIGPVAIGVIVFFVKAPEAGRTFSVKSRLIILALGLLTTGAAGYLQFLEAHERKQAVTERQDAERKQESADRKYDVDMAIMKTRLSDLAELVGTAVNRSSTDAGAIAAAVQKLARNPILSPRPDDGVSNGELRGQVVLYAYQLRNLQEKFSNEQASLWERQRLSRMNTPTQPGSKDSNDAFQRAGQELIDLGSKQRGEFAFLRPTLAVLRTRLLRRIPTQDYSKLEAQTRLKYRGATEVVDNGFLAGPHPLADVADYLEMLAEQLPKDQRK